jgi:pimeloyl-ACP methyl ester carboxylesterase
MNHLMLIPGFMGSQLSRKRDAFRIWVDPLWAAGHAQDFLEELELDTPTDPRLQSNGVLHDVEITDFLRVGVYRQLHEFSLASNGLGLDPAHYHEFGYDWRKSVTEAAQDLETALVAIPGTDPIVLIAHSQGGLVVLALFAAAGPGAQRVAKVIAVGCPFAGLLKTIAMVEQGSGVLTTLFPADPIRALLHGMPSTYELMPRKAGLGLFMDSSGAASTPFASSLPPDRYDLILLAAARSVEALPFGLPVPLRLVEGFGYNTAVRAQGGATGLSITFDIDGDGTCPSASLRAVTGTAQEGEPARCTFSLPFGEHVGLVAEPLVLAYCKRELVGVRTPELLARVRSTMLPTGTENLLILETRDATGETSSTTAPPIVTSEHGRTLALIPNAEQTRWTARFLQPHGFDQLLISVDTTTVAPVAIVGT